MTVRRRNMVVSLQPRHPDVQEDSRKLTIEIDKQTGHELALSLQRLEQTSLHVTPAIKDLKLALDVELIGDPASRNAIREGSDAGATATDR